MAFASAILQIDAVQQTQKTILANYDAILTTQLAMTTCCAHFSLTTSPFPCICALHMILLFECAFLTGTSLVHPWKFPPNGLALIVFLPPQTFLTVVKAFQVISPALRMTLL